MAIIQYSHFPSKEYRWCLMWLRLFMMFKWACGQMAVHGLWMDTIKYRFLKQKWCLVSMDPKRPSFTNGYQHTVPPPPHTLTVSSRSVMVSSMLTSQTSSYGQMQGLTGPFFKYHILQRRKSHEVCTVLLDKGIFLKNQMTFVRKRSVWSSSTLKTVDLEYPLSLLVAWMVRLCLKFYKVWPHMHNRSYTVTNQFSLWGTRCLSFMFCVLQL